MRHAELLLNNLLYIFLIIKFKDTYFISNYYLVLYLANYRIGIAVFQYIFHIISLFLTYYSTIYIYL